MSKLFRSNVLNWTGWMVFVSVLWFGVCVGLRGYPLFRHPGLVRGPLLASAPAFAMTIVWLIATRKERALNRGWARRRREDDRRWREERRKDDERFQQEMTAKKALRELVLKSTGSEEFARKMTEKHWRDGVVHVFFLNPAGELRELTAARFLGQPFHPQDRPRVYVVRAGSPSLPSASADTVHWYYDYFLKWDEVPLWRIIKWGDDIIVQDAAGEQTPINVADMDEEARMRHLLMFVSNNTSVADRTLRTIAEYGVPVLRKGRQAGRGSQEEGRLRIALQLGSGIFEPGKSLNWEELDGRDPDRS